MLVNSVTQTISIPIEKRDKAVSLLWEILNSEKTTMLRIQQLAGLLNHLGKAIVPARAFTRRFYMKCVGLKQHHHIRVDKKLKYDWVTWLKFLSNNKCLTRPFVDFANTLVADEINWYTDASGSEIGGYFGSLWMYAMWEKTWINEETPSIEFLEL